MYPANPPPHSLTAYYQTYVAPKTCVAKAKTTSATAAGYGAGYGSNKTAVVTKNASYRCGVVCLTHSLTTQSYTPSFTSHTLSIQSILTHNEKEYFTQYSLTMNRNISTNGVTTLAYATYKDCVADWFAGFHFIRYV